MLFSKIQAKVHGNYLNAPQMYYQFTDFVFGVPTTNYYIGSDASWYFESDDATMIEQNGTIVYEFIKSAIDKNLTIQAYSSYNILWAFPYKFSYYSIIGAYPIVDVTG